MEMRVDDDGSTKAKGGELVAWRATCEQVGLFTAPFATPVTLTLNPLHVRVPCVPHECPTRHHFISHYPYSRVHIRG